MASEKDDPLDGASPNAFHSHEPDSYDDLLGVQTPIEALDLPMADFQGEFDQPGLAIDSESIPDIAIEIPNTQAFAQSKDINTDNTATAKPNSMLPRHEAAKQDLPNGPSLSKGYDDHVIEIFDTENKICIKEEDYEDPFNWTSIPDDVISISDDDDDNDVLMLRADGSSVPIKKEDDEVEFIWEKMGDRVIELDSDDEPSATSKPDLGKSFLKGLDPKGRRPPIDRSATMRAQEAYLRAHRRKHDIPEPSTNAGFTTRQEVLNELELQGRKRSDVSVQEEKFAWMKVGEASDEDAGRTFKELKCGYKIKVKTNSNTIYDDMQYQKAERAENVRRHNLKIEYEEALGAGDTDDSDKDEEGLFVTSFSKRPSSTKRRRTSGNEDDDTNGVKELSSGSQKKRKQNYQGKRSQKELDEDKTANMLAGIETYLAKKKFAEEQAQGTNTKSSKSLKSKNSRSKKSNRKVNGHRNDVLDLLTSNVFNEALANNDRDALPVSSETNKRRAMKAIIANVPLENKQEAKDDEATILKATVTLAPRKVTADGKGGWKLQGMASSLHNHQVIGANWMKCRETAGQQPLGGIMADGMVRLSNTGNICRAALFYQALRFWPEEAMLTLICA